MRYELKAHLFGLPLLSIPCIDDPEGVEVLIDELRTLKAHFKV